MAEHQPVNGDYKRKVLWLIGIATAVRLLLASQLELGIDEVYYWNFILYPDWSFFDHPLMTGIVGQLFTLNGLLKDDFFLRLGPAVLSAFSTWIMFLIGKRTGDGRSGYYAALLFTGSIYCSVIAGFSFIPDAPLTFFWVSALYAMTGFLPADTIDAAARRRMILFGVLAGLAMLSKYQGAFLWVGVFLYAIFFNRRWLRDYSFYLSGVISAALLMPILIWNLRNSFISFNYHSGRVTPAWGFRPDFLVTEIFGQVGYQNPVIYVLIVMALVALFRKKDFIKASYARMFLLMAAPLWLVFTSFSMFRATLPHWSAPAFISLIIVSAAYWSRNGSTKAYAWMKGAAWFLGFLLAVALWLINYSPLQLGKTSLETFGEYDFTQDLYGWDQVNDAFREVAAREEKSGTMPPGADIVTFKMFPAAHLDYYMAQPNNRKLFAIGKLDQIHIYAWINRYRGGLEKGQDYYHVSVSNYYKDPVKMLGDYFEKVEPIDTVAITRAGVTMRYALFYRLKSYKGNFADPLKDLGKSVIPPKPGGKKATSP